MGIGTACRFRQRAVIKLLLVEVSRGMSQRQLLGGVSMSTGQKLKKISRVLVPCLVALCLAAVTSGNAWAQQSQPTVHPKAKRLKKTTKVQKPQLPPLPSGPTGPVQQVPLDSMAPVPPQVSYQNSQLTINAPNSTLGDILRAVRKQTGAEIEIPPAKRARGDPSRTGSGARSHGGTVEWVAL